MAKKKRKVAYIQVRVSPRQKALYEIAADRADKPVSEWIRELLDRATEKLLTDQLEHESVEGGEILRRVPAINVDDLPPADE